jgi:tetratricopeptide (TPR) repeat protein
MISQGKFPNALKELRIIESLGPLTTDQQLRLKFLSSKLFLKQGRFKEGKKENDQLLKKSKEVGDQLRELDALINTIWVLQYLGKFDEGLQVAKRGEKLLKILTTTRQPGLKARQASLLQHKGSLLYHKGEQDQAQKLLETGIALKEKLGVEEGIVEALTHLGGIHLFKGELDPVLEYAQKIMDCSERINNRQGIARSHLVSGWYYRSKGELDQAMEHLQESKTLSEEIGDHLGLGASFRWIGMVYYSKAELNQTLEYVSKALEIFETMGFKLGKSRSLTMIGRVYRDKGELDQALEHYQKSLTISERVGFPQGIAMCLNNIGATYAELGDFKTATGHFERSLDISKQTNYGALSSDTLYQIIRFFVTELSPETVRRYLAELKAINQRLGDDPRINQRYQLTNAIILNSRNNLADKVTAQTIFRQVATEEIVSLELTEEALINLSGLLLFELETTGNDAAFNELNTVSQRLLTIAKTQSSYSLLAEAYLIQSKVQLIQLNLQEAKFLLTQANLISQEKGFSKLMEITSIEYDLLTKQSSIWEQIIEQKPSMSEIIKLTQIEDLIARMIHKRRYINEEELLAYAENAHQLVTGWKGE